MPCLDCRERNKKSASGVIVRLVLKVGLVLNLPFGVRCGERAN